MGFRGKARDSNAVQHDARPPAEAPLDKAGCRTRTDVGPVQPPRRLSRRTFFWIFPVDVFGSGPKTTLRGTL
jgi:hypothetical protein